MTDKGLRPQQEAFVEFYLQCWNASEAARRAGYSPKTAGVQAHELLKKPEIAARVRERISEIAMSADEVLLRLAEHARGSMEDFIDPASVTADFQKAQLAGKMHLIKKVKYTTRRETTNNGKADEKEAEIDTVEFELYDAQAALVHLGRNLKLWTDKQEVTGLDGAPLAIAITKMDVDEL